MLNVEYLYLRHTSSRTTRSTTMSRDFGYHGHAPIVGFATVTMTWSKTALYFIQGGHKAFSRDDRLRSVAAESKVGPRAEASRVFLWMVQCRSQHEQGLLATICLAKRESSRPFTMCYQPEPSLGRLSLIPISISVVSHRPRVCVSRQRRLADQCIGVSTASATTNPCLHVAMLVMPRATCNGSPNPRSVWIVMPVIVSIVLGRFISSALNREFAVQVAYAEWASERESAERHDLDERKEQ